MINESSTTLDHAAVVDSLNYNPTGKATSNDVTAGGHLVVASSSAGAVGLGSTDSRAAFSAEGSLVTNPFDVINSPADPDGASSDVASNVAFDFGSLAPGASVSGTYVMAFGSNPAAVESAYAAAYQGPRPYQSVDSYSFLAPAGAPLHVYAQAIASGLGTSAAPAPTLELYDPSGKLIGKGDVVIQGANPENSTTDIVATATTNGTYKVRVLSADGAPVAYVIHVPNDLPYWAPLAPALASSADSGTLGDRITNFDNSIPAKTLSFQVVGVVKGNAVALYIDGTLVGSAVAASNPATVTVASNFKLADGVHMVTARQTMPGRPQSADSAPLALTIDTTPPIVQSVIINDGAPERSMVNSLTVTFSESMTYGSGPWSLRFHNSGLPVPNASMTVLKTFNGNRTLVLGFTSSTFFGGSIADGDYDLVINAAAFQDVAANALATSYTTTFSRRFGDFNGNGQVDAADLAVFRGAMDSAQNSPRYLWYADSNSNGVVDHNDYSVLGVPFWAPDVPVLSPGSDSGVTGDNRTNFNNATLAQAPAFQITGAASGTTLTLYVDGAPWISGLADASGTTILTASGNLKFADGSHVITVRQSMSGLPDSADSAPLTLTIDATPPVVQSVTVNDGSIQRSMVNHLTVVFSEKVTLGSGALSLLIHGSSTAPANTILTIANPSGDGRTFVVNFSGSAVVGGSLADGEYDLIVNPGLVQDLAANAMVGPSVTAFHRLFGDVDGDRDVDALDLSAIRTTLNKGIGSAGYLWYFDYRADGLVDADDLLEVRDRLRVSLPPLPANQPASLKAN